jgi:alkylated DNA repair protein (DNA oxidative demethylase)
VKFNPAVGTTDLFEEKRLDAMQKIGPDAFVLRGFALPFVEEIRRTVSALERAESFRNMVTPGGFTMSVAMANVGDLGWITDRRGYRYASIDPKSGAPWPVMPAAFMRLAREAADTAGFARFEPDACLINRYLPGNRLTLHQDRNELDFGAPIVSVSLGIPATFLFGGDERAYRPAQIPLYHGDVAVWGGASRLRYHGVKPLEEAVHPLLGSRRINLTFRKAG